MKKFILLTFITLGIFFQSNALFAQGEEFAFDLKASYREIKGAFNGEDLYVGEDEGFLAPKLKPNTGFGFSIGTFFLDEGFLDELYIGVNFCRTTFDASFSGIPLGKAKSNIFGIEIKKYFPSEPKKQNRERPILQGFARLGMEYGRLTVDNAYIHVSSTGAEKAVYSWGGIPLGGGFSINPPFVIPFSINFGIFYNIAAVLGVKSKGSSEEREFEDQMGISGPVIELSLLIHPFRIE